MPPGRGPGRAPGRGPGRGAGGGGGRMPLVKRGAAWRTVTACVRAADACARAARGLRDAFACLALAASRFACAVIAAMPIFRGSTTRERGATPTMSMPNSRPSPTISGAPRPDDQAPDTMSGAPLPDDHAMMSLLCCQRAANSCLRHPRKAPVLRASPARRRSRRPRPRSLRSTRWPRPPDRTCL